MVGCCNTKYHIHIIIKQQITLKRYLIINSSSPISHYKGCCKPLVSCCNHRKPILLNSHNLNKALYVIIFLMIYHFRGHCLMGQLHELTGHLEKAVSSYRRYLSKYGKKVINFMRKLQCQISGNVK